MKWMLIALGTKQRMCLHNHAFLNEAILIERVPFTLQHVRGLISTSHHDKLKSTAKCENCQQFGRTNTRIHDGVIKSKLLRASGPLRGKFTDPGEFPTQRPVARSFGVFFDQRMDKRLSKQSRRRWFEMWWRSLWHYSAAQLIEAERRMIMHR